MIRPKKHLGQHFLSDPNIARKIAGLLSDDQKIVCELGPGTGMLTKFLLENEKTKLTNKAATLRAVDPATSLKRGFSLVYTDGGDLVKSITQINPANTIKTEISDGRIISTINKTERK